MIYLTLILGIVIYIIGHYQIKKTSQTKKYGMIAYLGIIIASASLIGLFVNQVNIYLLLIMEFIILTVCAFFYMKDWFI